MSSRRRPGSSTRNTTPTDGKTMRIIKRGLTAVLAMAVLLAVALAVYVLRSFPTLDGRIEAPGVHAPVQVRRDAADVTHIEAQSLADAFFAMGYVHAQERGW